MSFFPSVGIAITLYRRQDYIHEYLKSLALYHGGVKRVVVDIAPIKHIEYRSEVITIDHQCSYSEAVNTGLRYLSTDILIFSNDDIIVHGPFIEDLIDPVLRRRNTIAGHRLMNGYLEGYMIAMHKQALRDIGYLDDRYPGCYEDVDFSRRAEIAGYSLVEVPTSNVEHADLGQLDNKCGNSLQEYKKKWQTSI